MGACLGVLQKMSVFRRGEHHQPQKAIDRLIELLRGTLSMREQREAVSPTRRFFAGIKKKLASFPFKKIVKDLILDDWVVPEREGISLRES